MKRILIVGAMLLSVAVTASAQTATAAGVFIVHGIPAADVPGAPAGLPVDVSVNGSCLLPNFTFGQIVGALQLSPGTYSVAVHFPATGRCTSAAVIGPAQIPFYAGESSTVIAHLSGSGGLTASKFVNNLSTTAANRARVSIFHTANAPAVDFYLTNQFGSATATRGLATSVINGESATVPVAGTGQQFAITAAGGAAAAFGPQVLGLQANKAYLLYVVGSLVNNSLTVIAKDVSELR